MATRDNEDFTSTLPLHTGEKRDRAGGREILSEYENKWTRLIDVIW